MLRRTLLLGAAAPALLTLGTAAADIWTPLPTGLGPGETNTAIDYQAEDRLWVAPWRQAAAAAAGRDLRGQGKRRAGVQRHRRPAGGIVGIAVSTSGTICRSANGGATWAWFTEGSRVEVCDATADRHPLLSTPSSASTGTPARGSRG